MEACQHIAKVTRSILAIIPAAGAGGGGGGALNDGVQLAADGLKTNSLALGFIVCNGNEYRSLK